MIEVPAPALQLLTRTENASGFAVKLDCGRNAPTPDVLHPRRRWRRASRLFGSVWRSSTITIGPKPPTTHQKYFRQQKLSVLTRFGTLFLVSSAIHTDARCAIRNSPALALELRSPCLRFRARRAARSRTSRLPPSRARGRRPRSAPLKPLRF